MAIRLPSVDDFSDRLRGPQVTSRVGRWLGIAFSVAFLTGIWSHLQYSPGWLPLPTRPMQLYQVTQGLHVVSGTVAVPLLLVKLWSVFPRLFNRPPPQLRALVLHLLERLSILALISAAIFQLTTGLMNSAQWYPWGFSFRTTHYAVAWVAISALAIHIAVKLPLIRQSLSTPMPKPSGDGLSRRGLLRATWAACALAALATAGATLEPLRKVSVFAVRSGSGPQGLPVNRSAAAAGVLGLADNPAWRLEVTYDGRTTSYALSDLEAMEQVTEDLPIACVEGWSATGTWTGVRVADLVRAVGAPAYSRVFFTSLQRFGSFRTSELPADFVQDPLPLLALALNGEPLNLDHGFPCRLIAPNRPGVMQTKWLHRVEVQS
jgi:DMSO/TMAO reductase YedYZ molybdopterin-dependent catalytic subunit